MNCPRCGSEATYAGYCASCSQPLSSTTSIARKSLAKAKEKQRKCKHTKWSEPKTTYIAAQGQQISRCLNCGLIRHMEVAS